MRVLSVVGLGLLVFVGCAPAASSSSAGAQSATPTPLPTPIIPVKPTYTVQEGTVVETLSFTGRASPVLEQALYFEADGMVDQVLIKRSDWVQAGALLAELDISSLERSLAQKRLSLQTAEIKLQEAEEALGENLAQATVALADAERSLNQARTVDTQITLIQANNSLNNAISARDSAQEAYDTAWDPARDWELGDPRRADRLVAEREAATANLQNADNNLVLARLQYRQTTLSVEDQLRMLQRQVETAESTVQKYEKGVDQQLTIDIENIRLDIQDIEKSIAASRLVAPFGGQITSLNLDPGDRVTAYTAVLVLADPTQLEITAELGSSDLAVMSINQAAQITLRNRPEQALTGSVRLLPYPYGGGTGDTTSSDTAVHVAVEGDVQLSMGELATVVIVLQEKENVLWLPPAAIRSYQGRYFVVIQLEDGQGQKRSDVLLGISTDTRVEITAGVEAGQLVVGE
jgi:multidrug efflux pump subunit AcrA (membrane-fusion protein)